MKGGLANSGLIVWPSALCLLLLSGCFHHKPATVQEHSSTRSRSQLEADGGYRIKSGDTLYAIAFSFGLDHRDVAKWNGISSPYVIYPGRKLRLSPSPVSRQGGGSRRSSTVQIASVKSPGKVTSTEQSANKTAPTSVKRAKTPVATKNTRLKTSRPKATPSSTTDPGSWKWPTQGRVLRGYVAANPARNGLDIAGKDGQAIIASAAGKVVYSGNGLIGYGELIIIKHSEKMLSAYAHNSERLVAEGEQVSSGQKIAKMGRNDRNEQLLHFEIRSRGKPVDPIKFLPAK